jgi:phosphotransferase system HPr-like phosphotransfer protein
MEAIAQSNPPADLAIVTSLERPLGRFVSFAVSFCNMDQLRTLDPPIGLAKQLLELSPLGAQRGQSIEFFSEGEKGGSQAMHDLLRPIDKILKQHGIKSINYQRTIVADSLFFVGLE